jgi:hypothetical protein
VTEGAIITLQDVSTVYEGESIPAIKGINLTIKRNELQNQVTIFQITKSVALVVIAVEAVLLYAARKKKQ